MKLINIIKGFLIGVALIIPGLSGSIFAIILGVYEDGLDAIANFKSNPIKNILFLLPFAIGGGLGIIISAGLVLTVTARFPVMSYMFFAGLVIGSYPVITRKINIKEFKPIYLVGIVLAVAVMILISNLAATNHTADHIAFTRLYSVGSFVVIFFAGLFSMSMMAIPGVSGSIMIIIIGYYGTVYNALSEVGNLIRHTIAFNIPMWLESFYTVLILVPFALGSLVGVIYISKILLFCLERAEKFVYSCVIGALIGTVYILLNMGVFPNLPVGRSAIDMLIFAVVAVSSLGAGILCTLLLDR